MNDPATPETPAPAEPTGKALTIPFRSDAETRKQLDELVTHQSSQLGVRLDRSKVLRRLVAEAHKKMRK